MQAMLCTGSRAFHVLASIAIAALAAVVYRRSVECEFCFDDHLAIVNNNDTIASQTTIADVFLNDFWGRRLTEEVSHKSYRPVTILTYRLLRSTLTLWAPAFHALNVVLHAFVSVLVYSLSVALGYGALAAFLSGSTFAIHPVHVEAVTGTVGTAELLCAMFYLAAIVVRIRSAQTTGLKRIISMAIISILFWLSVLSKETGVTLPALLIILDLVTYMQGDTTKKFPSTDFSFWIANLAAYFGLRKHLMDIATLSTSQLLRRTENPFLFIDSVLGKVLSLLYLQFRYAQLLFFPDELCAEYSYNCIPVVLSLKDPRAWLGIGAAVAVVIVIVTLLSKRAYRAIFVCALAGAPYLPASGIFVRVGTLLAERLLYLPSVGFCLAVSAIACTPFLKSAKLDRVVRFLILAAVLLFCVWGFARTEDRIMDWKDDESLFRSAVRVCNASAKMHQQLGQVHMNKGDLDEALDEFLLSTQIDPEFCDVDLSLGTVYAKQGQWRRSIDHFKRNLDCPFTRQRSYETLVQIFQTMMAAQPNNIDVQVELAEILEQIEQSESAIILYRSGAAAALERLKDPKRARKYLKSALKLAPGRCDLLYWLGMSYEAGGMNQEGLQAFEKAIQCRNSKYGCQPVPNEGNCVVAAFGQLQGKYSTMMATAQDAATFSRIGTSLLHVAAETAAAAEKGLSIPQDYRALGMQHISRAMMILIQEREMKTLGDLYHGLEELLDEKELPCTVLYALATHMTEGKRSKSTYSKARALLNLVSRDACVAPAAQITQAAQALSRQLQEV